MFHNALFSTQTMDLGLGRGAIKKYEGESVNDIIHGKGKIEFLNGNSLEGEFEVCSVHFIRDSANTSQKKIKER